MTQGGSGTQDLRSNHLIWDLGSRGSRIEHPGSKIQDLGSNNDLGSRIKDLILTQERLRNDSGRR